ncbi:hypothetical protein E4U56_000563 [Claviceps arundinis]|uniref:NDT80 domain-containing protein n=1 Tax=Claviceps arundinis TaxID=1623583 RepID=A0A9P7MTM2_9HYPO|nr:hypothetical protein E4U56_000563 [Claviceps arundinis]
MAMFTSVPAAPATAPSEAMMVDLNHAALAQSITMGAFDQDFNFDEAYFDDTPIPALPFTPTFDFEPFSTTFDDPFAYSGRALEPAPKPDALDEESSPQELDNKLLGFSDPIPNATVVDDAGKTVDVNMTAELYGMFFVAEDVFSGEYTGRPLELTCYRRNLWQCSGQITLPKNLSHLKDEQGQQVTVDALSASITAVESIEGKPTEIINIPWKTSNPQTGPGEDAKVAGEPPKIPLELSTAQEADDIRVTLPVSWKRLQFKHATANNGRRKGLQQHYVVHMNLMAKSKSSNDTIKIAHIQSGPVIVRGRSPRNFDGRNDVPLIGEKRTERKNVAGSESAAVKMERENIQSTLQRFQSSRSSVGMTSTELFTHSQQQQQPPQSMSQSPHTVKKRALLTTGNRSSVPIWSTDGKSTMASGSQSHRGPFNRPNTAVPVSLSLSEDEISPARAASELQSPLMGKMLSVIGPSSPVDDPDPLYEYFPVTDWMPPIDAVYRPHAVHHTIVPPEVKAQQGGSRAKRYFTAE